MTQEKPICNDCGKEMEPKEINYWHENIVCGDCFDLRYAEAKEGMNF